MIIERLVSYYLHQVLCYWAQEYCYCSILYYQQWVISYLLGMINVEVIMNSGMPFIFGFRRSLRFLNPMDAPGVFFYYQFKCIEMERSSYISWWCNTCNDSMASNWYDIRVIWNYSIIWLVFPNDLLFPSSSNLIISFIKNRYLELVLFQIKSLSLKTLYPLLLPKLLNILTFS